MIKNETTKSIKIDNTMENHPKCSLMIKKEMVATITESNVR